MEVQHSVRVTGDANTAFEWILDVSQWPRLFPPCLKARVLEETETLQRIELVAKANDQVLSWQSSRHLDRQALTIHFKQTRPSPLVTFMTGTWVVEPHGDECDIRLIHAFDIKDDVAGLIDGVTTPDEARAFMERTVEHNSQRELAAIKQRFQRRQWQHEFEARQVLPFSRDVIHTLLADASGWPWLLPHCRDVEVHYDDGQYQEFTMVVDVKGDQERIRSIRTLSTDAIDYFQPTPPPALLEHRGRWTLTEVPGGVEVVSWHGVQLNPDFWTESDPETARKTVADAINTNSLGTLQAIIDVLGGEHDEAA